MANFDSSKLELEVVQGTTFDAKLEVWDVDQYGVETNLTDLTGWTASWKIRECTQTATALTVTPTIDTVTSQISLVLTATQTGTLNPVDYEHNVRITKGSEVRELAWGPLAVKASI